MRALAGILGQLDETVETSSPSSLAVLSWPRVLRESMPDLESLIAAADGLFDTALEDFNQTREREGSKLQAQGAVPVFLANHVPDRLEPKP